jgi:hypothetical protein
MPCYLIMWPSMLSRKTAMRTILSEYWENMETAR